MLDRVLVLDFGSQYNQLIARRIRELKVFSEIVPHDIAAEEVLGRNARALVLSGGPASVLFTRPPLPDPAIFNLGIPVLGICYGMQAMAQMLGGRVRAGHRREYGSAELRRTGPGPLLHGLPERTRVWMSHGDTVTQLPRGFRRIARTSNVACAACADEERRLYGVQFHPEVAHTPLGARVLANFVLDIARAQPTWTMRSFIREQVRAIRSRVLSQTSMVHGSVSRVLCAVSGGVDSSVLAALLARAVGKQLVAVFVDNGLLRHGEADEVRAALGRRMTLHAVNARTRFYRVLAGITNPERKRKLIGREFIRVFEQEALRQGSVRFLAQGTLYPDLIESRSAFGGPSATIKTHHNVGGLPRRMKLELLEPLRELFKDEVRQLGRALGLPETLIRRHPFPGPGLAVRIIGAVTPERVRLLQAADHVFVSELRRAGYYDQVWQALAVLLPVRSVGVMGDERTYENVIALRAVTSLDAMTADW
ncbi:glutamine-hydrolyzing GMP synthase, partial [candidate division WOR-3 bacterium]|nr:glutamine-hydrolyzing GMP synthase [candidate division WOR-3 bacterium]